MVSPYLERRLRSYREALREIRKRHSARSARKAKEKKASDKGGHLRLIQSDPKRSTAGEQGKDA